MSSARRLTQGLLAAAVLLAVPPASGQQAGDHVSVRLFDGRNISSLVLVTTDGDLTLFAQVDGEATATVAPGDSVLVRPGSLGLQVQVGGLDIHQDELHVRASEGGSVDVRASHNGQAVTRRYPGTIDVRRSASGTLHVTNTVPIETYVASVVGKEYGLDDEEGTKAMAVVARTFAARSMADNAGSTGDGISSQVYHGLDGVNEASRSAADATRGTILTFESRPIVAVYSASNGGQSARNSDVWSGEPLPYLRARRDRFDRAASPYNDWLSRLERSRVHAALSDFLGATVNNISVGSRSDDGRASKMRIELDGAPDATISGSEFRRILAGRFGATTLRSTLFDVKREGDHYLFEGSGYGHGVGLSQWGAHEMASRGYDFEEILRFYYPGAGVQSMDDLGFEVGAPVAVVDSDPPESVSTRERPDPEPRLGRSVSPRIRSWTTSGTSRGDTSARKRVGW